MKITEFDKHFPDEHSCRMDMKTKREREGVVCKRCGNNNHYWLSGLYQWKCKGCGFRTTLRSGTVMHDSKLTFLTWYRCIALMAMAKKPMSAHEMQRQLGMKRYEPVWLMMKKIRRAMGQRDQRYTLEDMVEIDEGYVTTATPVGTKLRRGKGSQRKQDVLVMAESTPLEEINTGRKHRHCRFFKMKVLQKGDAHTVKGVVKESIKEKTIVFTDKAKSYVDIANYVEGHVSVLSSKTSTQDTLRWVHTAISNAKRTLLGIYHVISGENLQLYLDEFCYKLNRRYFGDQLFHRVAIAVASSRYTQAD